MKANEHREPICEIQKITQEIENKFLFKSQKYNVYVKNEEEIEILMKYLGVDFVKHKSSKMSFTSYLTNTELILYYNHKESLVSLFKSNGFLGIFKNRGNKLNKALSLKAFINPEEHPEEFI